ncbi:serine/arginine-rich splicing factor RSZ21-like isoform X2 [Coccinella septempunctata]|uniref:serine/arginine-rich splicing factor RSZ21-like isoform X2 n=1 Tax=Coccinella septempunctata TaxID=41139 RepID=UPI001D07EBF8|nr:serine/arginine-rich splicing factor RSZ21-like isoform X2 [Coccinella septempunctata]
MRDDRENSASPVPRKSRSTSRSSIGSAKSGASRSSFSKSRSRSRSRSSEADGYRLHIADIGEEVRKSDLEKVFSPYGGLKEVWMTNSTPCFGFAVFKDRKSASAALRATDGMEVAGCRIRVTHARPRTRGSGRRFFNTNMRCYQCGYSGHFYRDCPDMNGGGGGGKRDAGHMVFNCMVWLCKLYGLVDDGVHVKCHWVWIHKFMAMLLGAIG